MMNPPVSEVRCLEHSTLKVPYEVLNKKFRVTQKVLDREAAYISAASLEVEKLISEIPHGQIPAPNGFGDDDGKKTPNSNEESPLVEDVKFSEDCSRSRSLSDIPGTSSQAFRESGAGGGVRGKDVSRILGVLCERLASLKRKAGESIADELEAARAVRRRVQHLKSYNPAPEGVIVPLNQSLSNASWKRTRLNRMLIDHLLRSGMYDTAKMLSDDLGIRELTNVDVFWAAKEVEESLRRHETSRMVAWCYENKSKLRKIKSTLELDIRIQEFVELVRSGKRLEAVKLARKYLAVAETEGEDQMSAVKKCMGLLAFPVNTTILPYSELLSNDRWQHLINHFREEHARLYQLAPTSVLGAVCQAGLAALKTPQCYKHTSKNTNCPVCSEPLSTLASVLPYAHCAHSQLVCHISGESLNENNPPLVLPSGYVYGTKSLEEMARMNGGNVICPRSGQLRALPGPSPSEWQNCYIHQKEIREMVNMKSKSFETYIRIKIESIKNAVVICRNCSYALTDDVPVIEADLKVWQLFCNKDEPSKEALIADMIYNFSSIDRAKNFSVNEIADVQDVKPLKTITMTVILADLKVGKDRTLSKLDASMLNIIKSFLSGCLLGMSSNSILDLTKFFNSSTGDLFPRISYLFIDECVFETIAEDVAGIGQVTSETEVIISSYRDVGYYERLRSSLQSEMVNLQGFKTLFEELNTLWSNVFSTAPIPSFRNGLLIAATSTKSAKQGLMESARRLRANVIDFSLLSIPLTDVSKMNTSLTTLLNEAINSASVCNTVLALEDLEILSPSSGKSTESSVNEVNKLKVINHICHCFDALSPESTLVVAVVTSKPHLIPPRLRSAGRLRKEVYLPLPKESDRIIILQSLTSGAPEFRDCDLRNLAKLTPGYDIADLEKLVATILLAAQEAGSAEIDAKHIKLALSRVIPSVLHGSIGLVDLTRESSLDDVVGLKPVKLDLIKAIVWPLKHPEAFLRLGVHPPKGILLYGPPGCAKTTLVRTVASSHQVNFLAVSAAELYASGLGESEKIIANLFHQARLASPCILFIDELEAIVGSREGSSGTRKSNETILSTFLIEIDGIGTKAELVHDGTSQPTVLDVPRVILVAATNRPDLIDAALLRPGRFDRLVPVPPPGETERYEILKKCTSNTPLNPEVNLMQIAAETENYSGADLVNLCNEAALLALEEDMNIQSVSMHHFMKSKAQSTSSISTATLRAFHNYCSSLTPTRASSS